MSLTDPSPPPPPLQFDCSPAVVQAGVKSAMWLGLSSPFYSLGMLESSLTLTANGCGTPTNFTSATNSTRRLQLRRLAQLLGDPTLSQVTSSGSTSNAYATVLSTVPSSSAEGILQSSNNTAVLYASLVAAVAIDPVIADLVKVLSVSVTQLGNSSPATDNLALILGLVLGLGLGGGLLAAAAIVVVLRMRQAAAAKRAAGGEGSPSGSGKPLVSSPAPPVQVAEAGSPPYIAVVMPRLAGDYSGPAFAPGPAVSEAAPLPVEVAPPPMERQYADGLPRVNSHPIV